MKNEDFLLLFGQSVKNKRNLKKISQEELAIRCGFDRTYISLIERGKRNPSLLNIHKLCIGLNCTLVDFFTGVNFE